MKTKLNCEEAQRNSLLESILHLITCNLNHCRALCTVSQTKVTMKTKQILQKIPHNWLRTLLFSLLCFRFFSAFLDTSKAL